MDLSNENIIHIKGNKVEYIQFKKLLEYKELIHAFTLSKYDFDVGSNDTFLTDKDRFINNYKIISQELGIDYNNIIRPYQTHTNCVKTVENKVEKISIFPNELKNVDGLITNKSNIFFSLGYADCTPLFIYDPVKKVIADIHSGWRGTLQKISKIAIQEMIKKYNCNPEDIICCIGPTIRKCHFEVDKDVRDLFYCEYNKVLGTTPTGFACDGGSGSYCEYNKVLGTTPTGFACDGGSGSYNKFKYTNMINDIIEQKGDKYYIDTVLINKLVLKQIGLLDKNIIDSNICSVCNKDIIHSYRAYGKNAGRGTAIMGLKIGG